MSKKMTVFFTIIIAAICAFYIFPQMAAAQFVSGNLGTDTLAKFQESISKWGTTLVDKTRILFGITLTIQVVILGIKSVLQRSTIDELLGQFVHTIMFAAIILWMINDYQSITKSIVYGLQDISRDLGYDQSASGDPIRMAFNVIEMLFEKISSTSWELKKIPYAFFLLFIAVALGVAFALIGTVIIIIKCEFLIIANAAILLLGLAGAQMFKDYAFNVMRYVLSVGFKLFVLEITVGIGMEVFSSLKLASHVKNAAELDAVTLIIALCCAVMILVLAITLPNAISGVLSGAQIQSGNPLAAAGKAVGSKAGSLAFGAATAGAGFAYGAAKSAPGMARDAYTVARSEGASGVMGTAGGMARAVWQSRQTAASGTANKNMEDNPGSMRNQLASRANAVRAERELNKPDSSKQSSNSGGSGQAAPQQSGAGGSGQAAPQQPSAGGSEQMAPEHSSAGGSGQAAPRQSTANASEKAVTKNVSSMQSTLTSMSKKTTGTVDMRSFNSEKGDKK